MKQTFGWEYTVAKWSGRWACVAVSVGIFLFIAFVGMHLLDPNTAPIGTNLNYEIKQSFVFGAIAALFVLPAMIVKRSRRAWWLLGILGVGFVAFFMGQIVAMYFGHVNLDGSQVLHQTLFTVMALPAGLLSIVLLHLAERKIEWFT